MLPPEWAVAGFYTLVLDGGVLVVSNRFTKDEAVVPEAFVVAAGGPGQVEVHTNWSRSRAVLRGRGADVFEGLNCLQLVGGFLGQAPPPKRVRRVGGGGAMALEDKEKAKLPRDGGDEGAGGATEDEPPKQQRLEDQPAVAEGAASEKEEEDEADYGQSEHGEEDGHLGQEVLDEMDYEPSPGL